MHPTSALGLAFSDDEIRNLGAVWQHCAHEIWISPQSQGKDGLDYSEIINFNVQFYLGKVRVLKNIHVLKPAIGQVERLSKHKHLALKSG